MKLHEVQRLQKLAGINEAFINAPNSFKFNIGNKVYSTYDEDNYDSDYEPESFKVISAVEGKSNIPQDTSYTIYYGGNDSRVINGNWYLVRNPRFFHAYYWYPESKLTYDSKGESLEEAFISAPGAKFIIGDIVYDRWANGDDNKPLEIIDTVPNMSSIPEAPDNMSLSWGDVSRYSPEDINSYWYRVRPIGVWYPQNELSFNSNEGPLEEAFINTPGGYKFEIGDIVTDLSDNSVEIIDRELNWRKVLDKPSHRTAVGVQQGELLDFDFITPNYSSPYENKPYYLVKYFKYAYPTRSIWWAEEQLQLLNTP